MSFHQDMRERLMTDLQSLVARHHKMGAHLQNKDRELPADWTEAASVISNDEVLEGLDAVATAEIEAIRFAVLRIDEGTWEACMQCGESIGEARLRAIPTATRCIRCAE